MEGYKKKIFYLILSLAGFCLLIASVASAAESPILSVSPAIGTFVVGSTFDVSLFLDTKEESVNAVAVYLSFPPDKLQLVDRFSEKSAVEFWVVPPRFNNQRGTIEFQGGMPGGLKAGKALIAKFTFRVSALGRGALKFLPDSKVLLNDGKGTDALGRVDNGVYSFILPPPLGPMVVSETHPDQSKFNSNPTVILKWANNRPTDDYSYVINDEPVDAPDDISEGIKTETVYKNLSDGAHYFHVKALRDGAWGGITHFAVNVDGKPPAEFLVNILPSRRTAEKNLIVKFATTDALSGLDYYKLKIIPLNAPCEAVDCQEFFIEAQSPYISRELELGSYDVIVRAFDKAGNYRDSVTNFKIVKPVFEIISNEGIRIKDILTVSWMWVWIVSGILLIVLFFAAWKLKRWYDSIEQKRTGKDLPDLVKEKLEELKKYKNKYGRTLVLLFIFGGMMFGGHYVLAGIELGPPLVTNISRNISNEEIFYIGGRTEAANTTVIIYFQSLQNGETLSETVASNNRGEWFYRHNTFLTSGDYLLWTQGKLGENMSPPSPQINMTVRPTALQFGASRISYEVLYLIVIAALILIFLSLVVYAVFHARRARRHYKLFKKEVGEAEEAIRRGFALLRRDIQEELAIIKKAGMNKELSHEAKEKEAQLLEDLEKVKNYIGKEVFDIERIGYLE